MAERHWSYADDLTILEGSKKFKYQEIARQLGKAFTRHQVRGRHLRLKEWKAEHDFTSNKEFLAFLHSSEGQVMHGKVKSEEQPKATSAIPPMAKEEEVSYSIKGENQGVTVKMVEAANQEGALEEALKKAKINLEVWEVERWKAKKYNGFYRSRSFQTPGMKNDWRREATVLEMWSVEVSLIKKTVKATDELSSIRTAILQAIRDHAPSYEPIEYPHVAAATERFSLEIFAPDPHHGKLAWARETGTNYDSQISDRIYSLAIDSLIARATGLSIEEIVLPLGNDFFHVDTPENTTTAGTRQDVDTRWQKTFLRMKRTVISKIEQLRLIAPVKIITVAGNHDKSKMFYFGDTLQSWFHNAVDVVVDNEPTYHKYHNYGINLIGFSHGDKGKWVNYPMQMAHDAKELFAKSRVYEWHLGHFHKREERTRRLNDLHRPLVTDELNTDTIGGVTIRRVPSLGGTDAWHAENMYCHSPRQADMFLWSRDRGLAGTFTYTYLGEAEKNAA